MDEMIERKEVFRTLKCQFTEREMLSIGGSMANAIREKGRLENEFISIKKQYASDIGKQEAEITSLAERLNTGWEMRRVECEEVKDFNTGTVKVYRKDHAFVDVAKVLNVNGRMELLPIEERPMSSEERQLGLFPSATIDESEEDEGQEAKACNSAISSDSSESGQALPQISQEPSEIPHHESQDNAGQEIDLSQGVRTRGAKTASELTEAERDDFIGKTDLPEDQNEFYNREPLKDSKKRGPKPKKGMVLPE